ncbi:MAG: oxygen-independent coproporphyrinogen III oxidase [Candidatus Caenarcaniphilales bacterium]|nr:oxygen-independent coproporphyrinogen III oxidase [Candidatus Caenarcaniphilales bacterium]
MNTYIFQIAGESIRLSSELLHKYDKVGPRYTSYPTAPEWQTSFSMKDWQEAVDRSNQIANSLSLYFHIPFCHSACYYCACNFVVSPHNQLADPYLAALDREISFLGKKIATGRTVKQIHLGGGTPTYLSAEQILDLIRSIKLSFDLSPSPDQEWSIEVDPRVTCTEQLSKLYAAGFNRVSLGVQDFNLEVQKAVNRIQSFEMVQSMLSDCRRIGYQSINFDLIYGLPHQTLETFRETIQQVIALNPDRIALFSYAHLPSLRPFQKAYIDESAMPAPEDKLQLFAEALQALSLADYEYIGLDHFAKPGDELCQARRQRSLQRNFQGYTTHAGLDLFGLGMTSISSFDGAYAQNEKRLNRYLEFFADDHQEISGLPLEKGFILSPDDFIRRDVIGRLLCHGILEIAEIEAKYQINFRTYFEPELEGIQILQNDELVILEADRLKVTMLGRIFLRNIGMVFDKYLRLNRNRIFSRTV